MIYLIGTAPQSYDYKQGTWEEFYNWIFPLLEFEFDIETTVSPWWCDKKLITMQFGWGNTQWVLQWSELSGVQKGLLKCLLEDRKRTKYIHNAIFECVVCLFHGIRVLNVYDTMLAEMVLKGGEHIVEYGLDDVCYRYLQITLDKTEQTTFGDNILTESKVRYAAQDVQWLYSLKQKIQAAAKGAGYDTFDLVVQLENDCVPAFAEMTFNGMEIDKGWWMNLAAEATPIVEEAKKTLDAWLWTPEFEFTARALNYISDHDKFLVNWNSGKQKAKIFTQLFPQLPGAGKAILKKWQSDALKAQQPVPSWLPYVLDGDYTEVERTIITDHREWLIREDLLIPAGISTINWNSTDQVLPIIQCVEPNMKNLDKEAKGRASHPIIEDLDDYLDTKKLLTTYGAAFIYGTEAESGKKAKLPKVEPDGKVRTRFLQILTTGRISSSNPNMQNIPAKESVGNKYRNAFIPGEGFDFVSSDYVSQELIVIAYLSKDPVWAEALTKGQDLHSIAAELVYGKKWKDAAEPGCAYYEYKYDGNVRSLAKQKCKCKGHKYMRTGCKTINFG